MSKVYHLTCQYCHSTYQRLHRTKYCSIRCYQEVRRIGTITPQGYIAKCYDCKLMLEHRYVMEQHIGRKLLSTEVVHHIDGNRQNNVISNLQIFQSGSEHSRHHWHSKRFFNDTHAECIGCKQIKPRSEFHPYLHTIIGVTARCKICYREYARISKQRKREPSA